MNTIRRLTAVGLAIFSTYAAGLALSGTPALASISHRYLSQLTEAPAPALQSGPFQGPTALAIDSGNLYIANNRTQPAIIDEFNSTGGFLSQFDGEGTLGFGTSSVAVNHATGEVYVSESNTGIVDVFSASGEFLAIWKGEDTPSGSFGESHVYVAVDNSTDPSDPNAGDVYVSDDPNGFVDVLKPEVGGKEKYVSRLTGRRESSLGQLVGLAVSQSSGELLVITDAGEAVDVFNPGTAVGEYELVLQLTGPPGVSFGEVEGVAVDGVDGDIYVADNSARTVYEFNSAGTYLGRLAGPPNALFGEVDDVAVGPAEDVYVADRRSNAVDVFGPNIVIPDVETGEFSNVQQATATLGGTLNPNKVDTTYFFQYGTSEALGESTAVTSAGSGEAMVTVSATLSGLPEDTTYYYRLVAEAEGEPHYGAIHTVTTLPVAPVALQTTQTVAALSATVDTQNTSTRFWFEYGPSGAYGQTTPETQLAGSLAGVRIQEQIDELQPETTYHYRLVTRNAAGIVTNGPDVTFTTTPLTPPTAATAGASGVSQNAATISGAVGTNGLQTSYGFEIGTEAGGYGPATGLGSLGGATTQTVSLTVGELQPGTTYHYRVSATNADGSTYGTDESFVTPGFPTLITVPAAPRLIAIPATVFPTVTKASTGKPETKKLTNIQKLAAALKACAKKPKDKRPACQRQARKRYAPAKKKK